MEIKYLKLIKTIAEHGSLANSAAHLYLTQSALSHQLKDLENQLGFKVFYRKRNEWTLTDEGQELYELAKKVLSEIDSSFYKIQQLKNGSQGTIRISTECYSFYQGLPAFVQKMGVLYPQIQIDLILEATHKPIAKLIAKEIDLAITATKPNEENLECFELFEDEIFAVMHQENSFAKQDYIKAKDFEEIHLIIHSYPIETVSVYEQFLKPNRVEPKQISAIPLTEVALELVAANFGVFCIPKWALKPFKLSDEFAYKKISLEGLKRKHYLVIRKEDTQKKYIQDFIINFRELFA